MVYHHALEGFEFIIIAFFTVFVVAVVFHLKYLEFQKLVRIIR